MLIVFIMWGTNDWKIPSTGIIGDKVTVLFVIVKRFADKSHQNDFIETKNSKVSTKFQYLLLKLAELDGIDS